MADAHDTRAADIEARRLRALEALSALDGDAADPRFERIARLAARLLSAARARIILIDDRRAWLKARHGVAEAETPRAGSLADALLKLGGGARIADAACLAALGANGAGRSLAWAPLIDPDGLILGLLIVEDFKGPQIGDADAVEALADLAAMSMAALVRDAEVARHDAQRSLDAERLYLALDAAKMGEFEWDIATDILLISPRMSRISQLPSGEMPARAGMAINDVIVPADREAARREIEQQLRLKGRFDIDYRPALDDPERKAWHRAFGVLVQGPDGAPERLIGVVQDVTQRRNADDQRENLLSELDHRIKNLLAVVQSVASQSARKSSSLDGFLKTFAARLKSMSSAHDLLSAARWRGATLARIAAAELGGLAPTQTRWDGPELFLSPRAAAALSLALHELAVNAVKYGALSVETGRVEVVWRRAPQGGFSLEWLETGGPMIAPPAQRGFGATLVEDVVGRELGGRATIEFRRSGVTAMIHAAADALIDSGSTETPAPAEDRIVETLGGEETFRPAAITGLKVLIVEDSLLLAMELEAGLEENGVEVVGCAAELSEALAMLSLTFDAAVLDADLNGQSVAPVAEILRREGRPFVFATGYADKAAPMGFDAPIVRKPYNVHQIARAIASVTGRG
jgi:two-component sensor histidine kinase